MSIKYKGFGWFLLLIGSLLSITYTLGFILATVVGQATNNGEEDNILVAITTLISRINPFLFTITSIIFVAQTKLTI